MRNYIVRRIFLMIPTMFVVTIVVFTLIRLIPGDVVDLMAMQHVREQSRGMEEPPLDADAIREMLGLNVPVHIQYARWIGVWPREDGGFSGLFQGDFGNSLWTKKPVIEAIGQRLPRTFELGVLAFIMAQLVAFPIGIISAVRQNSWADFLGRSFAIISLATPAFWLATLIIVFGSVYLKWSPPVQYFRLTEDLGQNLQQFLIPAFLVGTAMSATTMRMLRTTMLEVLRQDYIRTAWAKGLKERIIVIRHASRNAMMPVITIVSGQIPIMFGGVVIMEQIFGIPGMGRLFLDSVFRRDYPYVSALNMIFAGFGLFLILACDLSYAWLDPRIRAKAFK